MSSRNITTSSKEELVSGLLSTRGNHRQIRRYSIYWIIKYMRNSGSADAPSTNVAQIKLLSAFKSVI